MIANKNINCRKNIPAMEELFDSQHKNKNMQMRDARRDAIIKNANLTGCLGLKQRVFESLRGLNELNRRR